MSKSDLKTMLVESLISIEKDPLSFAILDLDSQLFCHAAFTRENLKEGI